MPLFVLPPCIFAELHQEMSVGLVLCRAMTRNFIFRAYLAPGRHFSGMCVFSRTSFIPKSTHVKLLYHKHYRSATAYSHIHRKFTNIFFIRRATRPFSAYPSRIFPYTVHSGNLPASAQERHPHRCRRSFPTESAPYFFRRKPRTAVRSRKPRRFFRTPYRSDNRRCTRVCALRRY